MTPTKSDAPLRVRVACSGLGLVRRGNEAWAQDLAEGLAQAGVDVELNGGGELSPKVAYRRFRTIRRTVWWLSRFSFHYRYAFEQRFFTRGLVRDLQRRPAEIVHVADPQLGWWLRERFRQRGPAVCFKDGLLLGPEWLWRFQHVQVLAPYYRTDALSQGYRAEHWHVIPHFVDTQRFSPAEPAQIASRVGRAPVVLAVGDLSPGSNKRIDTIINELGAIRGPALPHLWIVGQADEADRRRIEALGRAKLGERFRLLTNLQRDSMPEIFRSADLFVHAALREPFGIVFLEALASGLPVVAHHFPVTAWIVGDAGQTLDVEPEGAMARAVGALVSDPDRLRALSHTARRRAEEQFSRSRVIPRYLDAYRQIQADPRPDRE